MYTSLLMIASLLSVLSYNINYISYKRLRPVLFNIYNKKNIYNTTLEHIIPQSIYKNTNKKLSCDLHNLIMYPYKINIHRSNYKYISDIKIFDDSVILDENGNEDKYYGPLSKDFCIKNSKRKIFLPSDKFKGDISRAAMYFLYTYPNYKDKILKDVIDPYTILTWHHQFPVSDFEIYKSEEIEKVQGNKNIFIDKPELLVPKMEVILEKDLSIFNDYRY